jgi:hypothetical protein
MKYTDAAVEVLRKAKRPLTADEITELALKQGLIKPRGKTPSETMKARLYCHVRDVPDSPIRREAEAGVGSRARRGSVRWTHA